MGNLWSTPIFSPLHRLAIPSVCNRRIAPVSAGDPINIPEPKANGDLGSISWNSVSGISDIHMCLENAIARASSPGSFGGCEPTILPISVETHPGQQAFTIRPEFSRAKIAVSALIHALLTL